MMEDTHSSDQAQTQEATRIDIPERDEDLLSQCDVDTYRGSGPGGQHRNKTESAVRLRHIPSGIIVIASESRSQHQNREMALKRLRAKLEAKNRRPKPRKPSAPSKAAKEKRLEQKKEQSVVKKQRRRVSEEES